MKKVNCLIVILLMYCATVRAQYLQEVQNNILSYLDQIDKWDTSTNDNNFLDSSASYNKKLLDYLAVALVKNPATLTYDFPALKTTSLKIHTSDDKKFRIYCWNIGGGGAFSCNVIIQYQSIKGTKVKVMSDFSEKDEFSVSTGLYYSDLFTVKNKANKAYYVAIGTQKIAMGLYIEDVQAFSLDDNRLNADAKLFKTSKGFVSDITFSFETGLSGDNDPHIKMSADKQRLYIPVVTEDGGVTRKHITYVFDGNNYIFNKAASALPVNQK